jgi:serine/threonine protein kinase
METDNASASFVYSEAPVGKSKYVTFRHGKYELIKLIGQGMTSKVFMIRLAKDHNQFFALKVIVNSYFERRQEYILNEVKVLLSFNSNPHIISLVEYGRASFLDN